MALAWNTRPLLDWSDEKPIPVEFHFLSHRELYDNTIRSADRHHSSAGEWVAVGDGRWYTVAVVTRPVYVLPQELCLSFGCFSRTETVKRDGSTNMLVGPPIDEVATEFGALLSVLAREPLIPLGVRRNDGKPIKLHYGYAQVSRPRPADRMPDKGVDSNGLRRILCGLARASEADSNAMLAACRLYHAALSLSGYDVSTAYFLMVSAIESLSGHFFQGRRFPFDEIEKFRESARILSDMAKTASAEHVEALKEAMLKSEYFIWQKFRDFIEMFLPEEFWSPDELHPRGFLMLKIEKADLRRALREVYDARSAFAHTGAPFPPHVEQVLVIVWL